VSYSCILRAREICLDRTDYYVGLQNVCPLYLVLLDVYIQNNECEYNTSSDATCLTSYLQSCEMWRSVTFERSNSNKLVPLKITEYQSFIAEEAFTVIRLGQLN
jgi:hypothetical protein